MKDNGELSGQTVRVIPYLLGAPSIEEGCKRARVSKGSVYEWLKDDAFKNELQRRREQLTAIALDALAPFRTKLLAWSKPAGFLL